MNKSVIVSGIFLSKGVKSVKVTWVWKIKLDLHSKAVPFRCIKMIFECLNTKKDTTTKVFRFHSIFKKLKTTLFLR